MAAAPTQPARQARRLLLCRRFRVAELVGALGRPALHAKSLGFTHPITGERLQFTSDLPPDFQVNLASTRIIWQAGPSRMAGPELQPHQ